MRARAHLSSESRLAHRLQRVSLMSHALFPFVVMGQAEVGRTPVATLSDSLQIALVHVTSDGASNVLFREDLLAMRQDAGAAYLASRERLVRLVRARLVRMSIVSGPSRVRCLAFEHSFLAASCAVLPDLYETAHRQLHADALMLVVPRRDLLVIAPNLGRGFQDELASQLGATDHVFSLDPSGPAWIGSNDTMIPISVQSVADETETPIALRKRCA